MGNGFTSDFAYNSSHYVPDNMMNYDNPEVTALFEEAAQEQDSDRRLELYGQVIQIITRKTAPTSPSSTSRFPGSGPKTSTPPPHINSGHPYYVYEMSWN